MLKPYDQLLVRKCPEAYLGLQSLTEYLDLFSMCIRFAPRSIEINVEQPEIGANVSSQAQGVFCKLRGIEMAKTDRFGPNIFNEALRFGQPNFLPDTNA